MSTDGKKGVNVSYPLHPRSCINRSIEITKTVLLRSPKPEH
jgi:hypothetical protein